MGEKNTKHTTMINYKGNICNSYPKKMKTKRSYNEINQQPVRIKDQKDVNRVHKKRKYRCLLNI